MVGSKFALVFLAACVPALAFPELAAQHQRGVRIVPPPVPTYTGILPIPDAAHPFRAPGPNDRRGPCPALNTLANHGYLPRNGIASFEDFVNACTQAFNMQHDFAAFLSALGILAHGNPLENKVSIGLPSPLVSPLPGKTDGPIARGLAAHGRFEGDSSLTREDAAIGDDRNFQPQLFKQLTDLVAKYGNDSTVTGPRSIVTVRALQEFKILRFNSSQTRNKNFTFHIGRLFLSYGDAANVVTFFANGTDATLSVPTMTSFFRDQTFPKNWHRHSTVVLFNDIGSVGTAIANAYPVPPGKNNANGVYVPDPPIDGCSIYNDLVGNLPAGLANATGLYKYNVDLLLKALHFPFPACPPAIPHGVYNY